MVKLRKCIYYAMISLKTYTNIYYYQEIAGAEIAPVTPIKTRNVLTRLQKGRLIGLIEGGKSCAAAAALIGCGASTAKRLWLVYAQFSIAILLLLSALIYMI